MRRRAIVAGAVLVVGVLVYLLLIRDPLDGNAQIVRRQAPAFNVLYKEKFIHRVKARPGEFLRLRAHRGTLTATTTIRKLRIPDYRGDVAGLLPVFADAHARELARQYDGFRQTADNRARVHTAPGYEVGFSFTTPNGIGAGTDLLVLPFDEKHPREGVILSYRLTKQRGRQPARLRMTAKAMRSAFRSFEFGTDRF